MFDDRLNATWNQSFRSEGERRIADFLAAAGIRFVYEAGVLVIDAGKPKLWHPDFFLPEFAVYIEYYGLAGDPDYDHGIARKTAVYAEMGLAVIALFPEHLQGAWQGYLLDALGEIVQVRVETLARKRLGSGYRVVDGLANHVVLDFARYLMPPGLRGL